MRISAYKEKRKNACLSGSCLSLPCLVWALFVWTLSVWNLSISLDLDPVCVNPMYIYIYIFWI